MAWDKQEVMVPYHLVNEFSVSLQSKSVADGFVWTFTDVYGPQEGITRKRMWEELFEVIRKWLGPWCLGGDFNIIHFPSKRTGTHSLSSHMRFFSNFIDVHGSVDLQIHGAKFTWSNRQEAVVMSILDRFLVSPSWADHFPDVRQIALPNPDSDHTPILLNSEGTRFGLCPFRFESMWLEVLGFKDKACG